MEKRIDAWVDKKTVISVALGMLLAAWVAWLGAVLLHGAGIGGYGMGYGMGGGYGRGGMMQRGDVQGMRDRMQRMMNTTNNGNPAGTYEAGTDVPAGVDTSAQ